MKKTNLERYGTEFYFNNEKGKQTKLEKYGDPYFSNKEKAVRTCKENDIYRKARIKFKEILGEEEYKKFYLRIFEKVYKTKEKRYGNKYYSNNILALDKIYYIVQINTII